MVTLRVAAHVHSSWSYDAEYSLPEIAASFRRRRYDAVLMSEHDLGFDQRRWEEYQRACMAVSSEEFLLVPGIEYQDADNVVHTPVWGDEVPFLGAGRPTLDLLRSAQESGAVAVLAHPWRRNAIARYAPEWSPMLSAIEIWNRKYDGLAPHRSARGLAQEEGLGAFVSLDFHTRRQFFPLAMAVSVDGSPSAASVIEAIRRGRYEPEFLGVSALRFTGGIEAAALRLLESARRIVRGPARQLRDRLAG